MSHFSTLALSRMFQLNQNQLTPNHFILGCHHPHYPPEVEEAFCGLTRRRYRQSQFIVNQYWRRWMREYVPNLIDRKKWKLRSVQQCLSVRERGLTCLWCAWPSRRRSARTCRKKIRWFGGGLRQIRIMWHFVKRPFANEILSSAILSGSWSSGYGRRLLFWRSWVRIFSICLLQELQSLKRQTGGRDGPFLKKYLV